MKTDRKIKYDWLQGELCCRLPLAQSLPCSPPVPVPTCTRTSLYSLLHHMVPSSCDLPSSLFLESPDRGCPRAGAGPALGTSSIALPALPTPAGLGVAVGLPCPVAPFPESSPSLQPACGAIRGVSPLRRQLPLLLLPGLALQSFIWPVVSSSFIKIQLDITGFFFNTNVGRTFSPISSRKSRWVERDPAEALGQ